MTGEPFVLGRPGGPTWTIHPPQDCYGDGEFWAAAMELADDGMRARTTAQVHVVWDGPERGLVAYLRSLADDWAGWPGVRRWTSYERELSLDARHDGRAYVQLGVTLRQAGYDPEDTAWTARAVFGLEAGEELSRFVADLTQLVTPVS